MIDAYDSRVRHETSSDIKLVLMRTIATLIFSFTALAAATLAGCASSNRLSDGSMIGVMTTRQLPVVTIDSKDYRLAPGARIVGANNSSVTPNQVPANSKVRYRVDASGLVTHVWLLPPDR